MNPFAAPPIFRKVPVSEEPTTATLRALTRRPRTLMTPLLISTLNECGCWTRERSGNASGLVLLLELALRSIDELYLRLIECSLEFDRKGHCELSLMCTLARHMTHDDGGNRSIILRLELTFFDELEPAVHRITPVVA